MTKRHVFLFDIFLPMAGIATMGWLCSEAFALAGLRFLDSLEWMGLGAWFRGSSLRIFVWQASWPLFSLAWAALWGLWVLWNRETDFSTGRKRQERPIYSAFRDFFAWVEDDSSSVPALPVPDTELEILREKLRRTERELALFKRATHSAQFGESSATESAELRIPRFRTTETTSYRIPLPDLPAYELPESVSAREERLRKRATESATWLRNTYAQVPGVQAPARESPRDAETPKSNPPMPAGAAYGAGPKPQHPSKPNALSASPSSMRTAIESITSPPKALTTNPTSAPVPSPLSTKPAPVPEWSGMIAQEIAEQAERAKLGGDATALRSFRAHTPDTKPAAPAAADAHRFAGLAKL